MEAYDSNPYAAFALAHHATFSQVIEHAEVIQDSMAPPGSVEDALRYFTSNLSLWQEIEGALEWVHAEVAKLPPPLAEVSAAAPAAAAPEDQEDSEDEGEDEDAEGEEDSDAGQENGEEADGGGDGEPLKIEQLSEEELHAMFADMFNTALEIVTEA